MIPQQSKTYQEHVNQVQHLQNLNNLFRQMSEAVLVIDSSGKILSANTAAEQLLRQSSEALCGTEVSALWEDAHRIQLSLILSDETFIDECWSASIPTRREDGETIICDTKICPLRDCDGRTFAYSCILQDISHYRNSLEELGENKRKLSTLMDNLPGMAYRCRNDSQWTMEIVSKGCKELTGYSQQDVVANHGVSYAEIIVPEDRDAVKNGVQAGLSKNRPFRIQYRIRTKAGQTKWVWEQGIGIKSPDGDEIAIEGFIIDVTERVRAEHALKESESRTRAILDSTSRAFMLLDKQGLIKAFNQNASKFVKEVSGEDLRQGIEFDRLLNPSTASRTKQLLNNALQGQVVKFQRHYSTKDGELIYEMDFTPVEDDNQQVVGVCFGASDITEKRRMEQHQQALEERLQYSQKLESLGVLAGGIAHDFNNLLMGILGNAELALMDAGEQAEVRECLTDVISAVRRASELTDKLLAYSGKGMIAVNPINVSDLIRDMSDLFESTLPPAVSIQYDLDHDLPLVGGDRNQLRQSVDSIVTNATESFDERGGVITIRTGITKISRSGATNLISEDEITEGTYATIEITDNGCGMSDETLSKIFEPFYSTKFTGRGLGLAAVLGIVRRHKGAIKIDSVPGDGTSFTLLLPVFLTERKNNPEQSDTCKSVQTTKKILVVDDEKNSRDVAVAVLRKFGYEVIVAGNGEEALELLKEDIDDISAVMLDVMLPDIRGDILLKEIRKTEPLLPALFTSGYNEDVVIHSLGEEGSLGFIQKPYSPADLHMRFKRLLEAH